MHDLVYDLARSVMDEELIVYNADKSRSLVDSKYASLTDCSKPLRISTILPAKLRALLFQNCSNLGITGGSFSFAKCLRVLDLTESSISRFPSSIGQLKHLRFLVAPGMQNRSFPKCISGLSKLQYLNIHGSSQVSPRPESLGKLEHLMYLDLSGCSEIVELPKTSLENLKNLVHLELSTCSGLVRISEALCYLTKLQYLNLSGCSNLDRLPQDVGNLTELQYLYLSGCHKIDALPKSIRKLINLVHLDLSRCSFVIPKALGDLTKLKYLSLSGFFDDGRKAWQTIHSISFLANLEHLDLSWNPFESLPESIGDLKSLHTLDLSGCRKLNSLPDSIGSIDSLEVLVIDEYSELLKENIMESELKCNPFAHLVVCDEGDSGSNLHELEDRDPSELYISCLERLRVREEASAIQLRNKENISTLKLRWTVVACDLVAPRGLEDGDVLGELAPPSGLKHLVLIGYGSISFPNWLMMNISHHLPNLVSVQLRQLPSCTSLPPLGQLPNLKDLYLEYLNSLTKIRGDDFCAGKRAFPQLSKLTLRHMISLQEWNTTYRDEDGRVEFMFPVLHELVIEHCPRLSLKPCPPLFDRWQITNSDEVLNFREECDKSAAPRTSLLVSAANYYGSWSLLSHLSTLEELLVNHPTMTSLPESIRQLVSLRLLVLSDCENIMLPEWLGDLKSLQSLCIVGCLMIKSMSSSIRQLTKLQQLHITSNTELQRWCQSERKKKLADIKDIVSVLTNSIISLMLVYDILRIHIFM
jgi:Leucine-rich repeat (LRR) protein